MTLVIGFILGFVFSIVASHFGIKPFIKRGHYASAIYNDKRNEWTVRGRILSVSQKVAMIEADPTCKTRVIRK